MSAVHRKKIGLILLTAVATLVVFIRLFTARTGSKHEVLAKLGRTPASEERLPVSATPHIGEPEQQITLKDKTRDQAMQAWWQRRELDKQADWKIPISFYGKVVDQDMHPLFGANVQFEWTDLSAKGTSKTNTTSDEQGFFSLLDARGKNLGVYVSKEGYDAPKNAQARAFEFADPGERNYYEPNHNDPVLFQLRKKGEGANLIKKSIEIVLPGDGSTAKVDLATGKVSQGGQLEVQASKPWPPRPMSPHYDWKVALTIPDGGFVETPEEFAFEAPETGYLPSFEINMPSTASDWRVSAEKTLYFIYGEPKKYGRLQLRTDGNSRYVFIEYVLNPSGSRNLEFGPAKEVKGR
jgi:hypothetical protein